MENQVTPTPSVPQFQAITLVREVSERLIDVLDRHDDESRDIDLMDVFCEVAVVREVLEAVQVELTGEAVRDQRILKVFAERSGIPYGTVTRWARPFKVELAG